MAAFSTLAMIGLAGATGLFAGRKAAAAGQQGQPASIAAPGPVPAASTNLGPAPPPQDRTDIMGRGRAMVAAQRQKRKAAGGGTRKLTTGPRQPAPMAAPATLIGAGY